MPQLDKVTFLSQFFWLCIVFFSLYLLLVKFYLPSLARIVKVRNAVSNRSEDSQMVEAGESPTTGVYSNAIAASILAFQSRLNTLENWNAQQLQTVLPRLSPEFETNLVSYQKEALVSETILNNVVPPVNRSINSSGDSSLNDFFNASLAESITEN